MSNGDLPHDASHAVWARLGELTAEVRNANELRRETQRKLDGIGQDLAEIREQITPLLTDVEANAKRIGELEEAEDARLARESTEKGFRKGWMAGIAAGGGFVGGGLLKLLEWLGGGGPQPPIGH